MCQLNLYIIKSKNEDEIKNSLNQAFGFPIAQKVGNDEIISPFMENFPGYDCYVCAPMLCNCGSVQCSLQEYSNFKSVKDFKEYESKKNYETLLKIKSFLQDKNKDKIISEISEKRDKILKEPAIKRLNNADDNDNSYNEYLNFLNQNKYVFESFLYTLEKPKKNSISKNIDQAILDAKNANDFDYSEYNNLLKVVDGILKIADDIVLYSFWQDNEPLILKQTKTISRNDLSVEDVVFLHYNEALKIIK